MPPSLFLGDFEHVILLAVLRLGAEAYGTTIRREIEEQVGRQVSIGALYTALGRLERKGFVSSRFGEATPQRGGRAKRHYQLRAPGRAALQRSRRLLDQMWHGFEPGTGPR